MGLFNNLKEFLKRLLPPPVKTFNREMNSLKKEVYDLRQFILGLQSEQRKDTKRIIEILIQQQNQINKLEKIRIQSLDASGYASESVWAAIFNNTITDSRWLIDKSFSPGRWAVGYQYLYVMYRVLNETQPKNILELGLGQSTRMIAQYAAGHEGVEHIVIEQDKEWVDFFAKNYQVSLNTKIVHLPAVETQFQDDTETLIYKDFTDMIGNKTFDFISVDGPGHSRSNKYRRIDLIKMIPQNLNTRFCIMLDDYDDLACRNAWLIAKETLENCDVRFCEGIYRGRKSIAVLTDVTQKFLCSM